MPQARKKIRVVGTIYDALRKGWSDKQTKKIVMVGGAGSGKSYTIAFFLLKTALEHEDLAILITRKYNTTLRYTTIPLIHQFLKTLDEPYDENKTEQIIQFRNGSFIRFLGLDDPEKIKSAEFNVIWMEEATEFQYEDYLQLNLRLRRGNPYGVNKIVLSFNPVSKSSWVYREFFQRTEPDVLIHRSTYKDNPFLSKDFIRSLERLREQDERFYQVYAKGEFADISKQIYTNYEIREPDGILEDRILYGLDFGYTNPTALVKLAVSDGTIYVLDEFYRTHLTNTELINELKKHNIGRRVIVCDSSEPARIKELQLAGFNAVAAVKKDILHEIDLVKRHRIVISPRCVNFIKEIENYCWRTDRNGNTLEEPVKFNDHLLDAMRYAVVWSLSKQKTPVRSGKVELTPGW